MRPQHDPRSDQLNGGRDKTNCTEDNVDGAFESHTGGAHAALAAPKKVRVAAVTLSIRARSGRTAGKREANREQALTRQKASDVR